MTTLAAAVALASLIWLTDRTRHNNGLRRCQRLRFLSNHFNGYGITLRKVSLPLVTGSMVHKGLERLLKIMAAHDRLPSLGEMREVVAATIADYTREVETRGFRGILGGEQTEETIAEQCALVSGIIWVAARDFLPWLHQSFRVMHVEVERLHFLDCSCGAHPIDTEEHIRRGCAGIALMLRVDIIAARRAGHSLAYLDIKTSGWDSEARVDQYELDPQLALGTLDAEKLWGAEVTECFIIEFLKGRRQKDRYDPEGRKRQMSALCYGYKRPGNPPLAEDDWKPAYEWIDENGETKRAGRAYQRTGIWTLPESDWDFWRMTQAANPGLTASEFWIRQLPQSITDKVCSILGPMQRMDVQLASTRRAMLGEEKRWQERLWALYELQLQYPWASDEIQHWLDVNIPCSWACRPYGREHECEFVRVCHRQAGWEDPLGSGHYQPRLPHHEPELQQAIARGLLPAEAGEVDEED